MEGDSDVISKKKKNCGKREIDICFMHLTFMTSFYIIHLLARRAYYSFRNNRLDKARIEMSVLYPAFCFARKCADFVYLWHSGYGYGGAIPGTGRNGGFGDRQSRLEYYL